MFSDGSADIPPDGRRRRRRLPRLPLPQAPAGAATSEPAVFRHGVASGDPVADGVVLWTRVSGAAGRTVDVDWVVADDEGMTRPVRTAGRRPRRTPTTPST
ncbi:MAG TPA: PhoD-like phosphatase N-terminal domain-containing protein [Acidimicrobiia bacterium]|nr:PhoD-like phosphatase N-terminal domain-containing protein [Acidimicrobiia bacterium]